MLLQPMNYTSVSSGALETSDFSVEVDSYLMKQMFSQIAKNKIAYPVREILTNAWDTHAKYYLDLPNYASPVFRVRDDGPGLSHHDVMYNYTRVGKSLKRLDGKTAGAKGWGSKSPFAYLTSSGTGSSSWNLISRHGGEERHYIMSLSSEGMPQCAHVFTQETDLTGLEVFFSVREGDIFRFSEEAKEILWFFPEDQRPVSTLTIDNTQPTQTGDGWAMYDGHRVPIDRAHVRMGPVGYPIDFEAIGFSDWPWRSKKIVFDAPLGSLELTTSREELSYDDMTIATLTKILKDFEAEYIKQIHDALDAKVSHWEACLLAYQLKSEQGEKLVNYALRTYHRQLTTTDKELTCSAMLISRLSEDGPEIFRRAYTTTHRGTRSFLDGAKFAIDALSTCKVVIERKPSNSRNKFRQLIHDGVLSVGDRILWLRPTSDADEAKALDDLVDAKAIRLDPVKVTIPVFTVSRGPRPDKKLTRVRCLPSVGTALAPAYIDADETHVYVVEFGGRGREKTYSTGSDGRRLKGRSILDYLQQLETKIGLTKPSNIVVLKEYTDIPDHWVSVSDYVRDELEAAINWRQVSRYLTKGGELNDLMKHLIAIKPHITSAPVDLIAFIEDSTKTVEAEKKIKIPQKTIDQWVIFRNMFGDQHPKIVILESPLVAVNNALDEMFKKYPLLRLMMDQFSYWEFYGKDGALQLKESATQRKLMQLNHYLNLEGNQS